MKFTQYFLSGIFITVGLTCYLLAIAERDTKINIQGTSSELY